MSKNLKWGGILLVIFFVIGFIAIVNSSNSMSLAPSPLPTKHAQPSNAPEETGFDEFLTHEQLLSMTEDNPENILGKTFERDLYLEQQPTKISAEFITQTDTNDKNTILITCDMSSNDLTKLDGASAQRAVFTKTSQTEITFKAFDNSAGPYYKADCFLKQ